LHNRIFRTQEAEEEQVEIEKERQETNAGAGANRDDGEEGGNPAGATAFRSQEASQASAQEEECSIPGRPGTCWNRREKQTVIPGRIRGLKPIFLDQNSP
jgi:hypothetical protein